MTQEIHLRVGSSDASLGGTEESLRQLWKQLSDADLDVEQQTAPAPPGTKSATGILIGLAVLLRSKGGQALSAALRDWLTRHQSFHLTLQVGDVRFELSGAVPKDLDPTLQKLVALLERGLKG